MRRFISRAPATALLLFAIAIVWLIELKTGANLDDHTPTLVGLGAIIPWQFIVENREYWRLFTGMFLHGSWLHWAANSWTLYQLGFLYEMMFGTRRFVLFYFISGLIAATASSIHLPTNPPGISVGASGAVFGILGAFIFSIRRHPQWRHERWTRSLLQQLIFWAVFNLILGASIKIIDNTAHVAGLISGLLLGLLPHRVPPPPPGATIIDVRPYDDGMGLGSGPE